ncbi:MAG: hypothetical protein RIR34_862 [Actinomycetota bacterium]|jgi:proteasome accessory factor B
MAKQKPKSAAEAELAGLGYGKTDWDTSVEKRDASERQLGLTFALIYSTFGLTKREIFERLPGYTGGSRSAEALSKLFERDKRDIRALGVSIETIVPDDGDNQETRYRIPMQAFEWPQKVNLSPAQIGLIQLAVHCWSEASLSLEVEAALTRLRALGDTPTSEVVQELAPRFRAFDRAFDALAEAITECAPVTFNYRKPGSDKPEKRTIQPWRLMSVEGQWLLQGVDVNKDVARNFLLKRIVDKQIRVDFSPEASFERPTADQLERVERKLAEYTAKNRATLEILPGSAAWSHFEMDLLPNGTATLETSYMDEDLLAETVRGFAGQIRVISPSSLSDKVRSGLKKVADLHA